MTGPNSGLVGGYGGFTRGEAKTSGNFGYAFTKTLFPYAESNYFPNMSRRLNVDSALFNSNGYQTSATEGNTELDQCFAPSAASASCAIPLAAPWSG